MLVNVNDKSPYEGNGSNHISPTTIGLSITAITMLFLAFAQTVKKGKQLIQVSKEVPKLNIRLEVEFQVDVINCEIIDVQCGPSAVSGVYPEAVDPSEPVPIPGQIWGMVEGGNASAHRLVKCLIEQELSVILEVTYSIQVKSCRVINTPKSIIECCVPIPQNVSARFNGPVYT